jgi:hypothetical protein
VVFDSDFHAQTMSATDDVMKIAENIVCDFYGFWLVKGAGLAFGFFFLFHL